MNYLIQSLIFSCIVSITMASVAIALANPRFPHKCYDGERTYEIGVHHPENKCESITCQEDYTLVFNTCGSEVPPDGFKIVQDLTKKYPECCTKFIEIDNGEIEEQND